MMTSARVERQRLGDLDHLPLGERQARDRRVGREIGAEPVEQRRAPSARMLARSTSFSGPPRQRLAADEDVGGDVEIVEEVEFLVDEGDAGRDGVVDGQRRRARRRRRGSMPALGAVDAAEDLHQRRLAGAVLADEADHLAGRDVQEKPSSATTPG